MHYRFTDCMLDTQRYGLKWDRRQYGPNNCGRCSPRMWG